MNPVKRKALMETLKSIGRGLWFALMGLIVVALTAIVTSGQITDMGVSVAGFTLNLSVIILAVVGYVIKLLDTYIHNNQAIGSNGLAPGFLQNSSMPAPAQVTPAYVPPKPGTVVTPVPQAPVNDVPETPQAPAQPSEPVNPAPAPTVTQIPVTDATDAPVQNPVAPDPNVLNS